MRDGCDFVAACSVEGDSVRINLPLRRDGHVFSRHGRGNCLVPADEGVALPCRIRRSGNCRAVVLRDRGNFTAACSVEGDGVLIYLPLRRDGHIIGRHCRGNFLVPAEEGIALSCRVGGCGDCRAVVLRDRCNGTATCGVKGDRVRIDLPLRRDGHVFRRHGRGNFLIPADEGVARSCRVGRGGDIRSVVLRNGRNFTAACGIKGNCIFIRVPNRIERQRLVLRINSIKAIHLFAAVHGRPAGLGIACAGEQLAAQREDIVIEFDIRYRIAVAVFSGLIGHIPCARDTHIGLAGKLPEDGVKPLSECVAQCGNLFICQRIVIRQIALIQFLHFSGKLRHGSLCGILRRRAREQPHTVAHMQIADILIP